MRRLLDGAEWQRSAYGVFYNLNFPALPGPEVRGVRATYQWYRSAPTFGVLRHVAPDGFITVTPLMADLTAHELVAPLAQALG